MRIPEFLRLLDAHGADVSRWPRQYRERAEPLLAASAEARAALASARQLDALLLRGHAVHRDDPAVARVLHRLEAPLPRQRRSLKWWPTALLEFDFAPAWPRFAALAGVAALGFAVGLSDVGMALTKKSASVVVGTATSSDADLSLLVFEPDPLSAMRP
jgi:hypothetical protein